MRIFVDITEPGIIFHDVCRRAEPAGIKVERTILHKRDGLGGSVRDQHPFYGLGADFVITDEARVPLAAVERKTLDDLAKSSGIVDRRTPEGTKLFRQLRDLLAHPMPVLILEGGPSLLYRRVEPLLLGLQLWCAREGIAIVYSTGPLASSHTVFLLARKLAKEAASIAVEEYVAWLRLAGKEENELPREPTRPET